MGDGLKRASDYANEGIAPFLRDVVRGGTWEVTDRYLLTALGMRVDRRSELPEWVDGFARRHRLSFTHDAERERYKFI